MISFILTAKRLLEALLIAIKDKVFLSLVTTLLLINISGVLFYTKLEGWSYLDAIYFSWISLIPSSIDIGYAPITTLGKVFTMMYLVVGVGVMIGLLAMIARAVINFDKEETILREKLSDLREDYLEDRAAEKAAREAALKAKEAADAAKRAQVLAKNAAKHINKDRK